MGRARSPERLDSQQSATAAHCEGRSGGEAFGVARQIGSFGKPEVGKSWHTVAMRFFNTAGPIKPANHYCIPPLQRLDLQALLALVRQEKYFVLHAPRQTGKTSALLALRDLLNSGAEGSYRCVYVNVEGAQAMRENVEPAMRAILSELASRARATLKDVFFGEVWPGILAESGAAGALSEALAHWAEADDKPLVLLIDEIDSLVGDTLLAVLRQLRAGYDRRPAGFPQSVILCGVRDVRDYRIQSTAEQAIITGGSAFNIKAKSLRLGDFSEDETQALLQQHTEETGQEFTRKALQTVWAQTQGQPWLVNALADEACSNCPVAGNGHPITRNDILEAQEQLILRRETHLDQLADKLQEDRVRRVVEPILSGGEVRHHARDLEYVRDLGLLAPDSPPRMANPIYQEVVPRELGYVLQDSLDLQPAWYADDDGRLDMNKLLSAFSTFFREHAEHWLDHLGDYREAGPQLILQAYLQRVVNGGGRIEREYGLGRGRTDLLVLWPREAGQPSDLWERFVVECKVLRERHRKSLAWTVEQGVEQTLGYMGQCKAREGHLVVFDRRAKGRRHSEDGANGNGPRTDERGVVIWAL